jgi:hypothetical protein
MAVKEKEGFNTGETRHVYFRTVKEIKFNLLGEINLETRVPSLRQ